MPFTTEFTQAHVDKLTNAIASGVKKIMHNGKATEFQSTEEMIALRDRMKSEIAAAAASSAPAPSIPFMTRRTIYIRD